MQTRASRLPLTSIACFVFMVFMAGFSARSFAAAPVVLGQDMKNYPLGRHMDILEDRDTNLTINEVSSGEHAGSFAPSKSNSPNYGFSSSAYWIRFTVKNPGKKDVAWNIEVDYPTLDHVDLYAPSGQGGFTVRKSGDLMPFGNRDMNYRNFTFSMKSKGGEEATYYIRILSTSSIILPVYIWSPKRLLDRISNEQIIFGIFYGILLAMIVYHLFIFFSVRDRSYLYYVFFITLYSLYLFINNGFAFQYLWPESTWWGNVSLPFVIVFSLMAAIQFTRSFLDTVHVVPLADKVSLVLMGMCLFAMAISLLLPYSVSIRASSLLTLAGVALLLAMGIICLKRRYRLARYFLMAWVVLLLGVIIYIFKSYGLLPNNLFTAWSNLAGALLLAVLIGFAMADRINLMRGSLESLNTQLETLVYDRTREMKEAVSELKEKDLSMQRELDLAATIQMGILPPTPVRHNGLNIVAYYRSMSKVGGDFYDIFPMKGGNLGILIADVSGHGIPAAFVTAIAKIAFREATQKNLFPKDIFTVVNQEMIKTVKTAEYLTAFLAVISPSYEIYYANASHQKAIVVRKRSREIEVWDTDGLFVGAIPEAGERYEEKLDFLDFGDRLCLFTDGLVEARNNSDQEFGDARLHELLLGTMDLPLEDAKAEIIKALDAFCEGNIMRDDVSLLMLEVDPFYQHFLELRNKGFELLYKNEVGEAITELEKALEIDDRDAKAHSLLGKCYFKEGDYGKAAEHLVLYLSYNTEDADGWFLQANSLYNVKKYREAVHASQQACQLRPNFKNALVIQGLSLKKLGQADEARSIWEKILMLDRTHAIAAAELEALKSGG